MMIARNEGQQDIEQFEVVSFYRFAHIGPGAQFEQYVVAAFADGHEDRQEEDHDNDPFGERYPGDDGACLDAEDKSGGKQDEVEDGNRFEAERIAEVNQKIDSRGRKRIYPGYTRPGRSRR